MKWWNDEVGCGMKWWNDEEVVGWNDEMMKRLWDEMMKWWNGWDEMMNCRNRLDVITWHHRSRHRSPFNQKVSLPKCLQKYENAGFVASNGCTNPLLRNPHESQWIEWSKNLIYVGITSFLVWLVVLKVWTPFLVRMPVVPVVKLENQLRRNLLFDLWFRSFRSF